MDTNNKNITNKDLLTQSEINDYLCGNLKGSNLSDVKAKISENDFYREAVEGYQSMPNSINTLYEIKNPYRSFKFKYWNTQNFFFATLLPTIALLIYISFYDLKSKSEIINNSNTKDQNNLISEVINNNLNEINDTDEITVSNQIDYDETVSMQPKTVERIDNESVEYIQSLLPHQAIKINNLSNKINNDDVVGKTRYTYSNFPIYYILDLKIVDYRLVYKASLNDEEFNSGGLESKYENENSENIFLFELTKISYTYEDFLRNALSKFKNNDFKEALYYFNIILNQFPEDLNAHFYGGLCYYNIGFNIKAVEYFDFVIDHYITSFDQEAEWYKAKTFLNMDKIEEANKLMETIVEKNGFYSEVARKQLMLN